MNAKMKGKKVVEINVTRQCINQGIPGDVNACAIALAVKRAMRRARWVVVSYDSIEVVKGQAAGVRRATPPTRAARFIRRFDTELPVKPFRFRATFRPV